MRDVSHLAAATLAIGVLTDDLFGALMEAPSAPPASARHARDAFAGQAAAGRWLAEHDRAAVRPPAARTGRGLN